MNAPWCECDLACPFRTWLLNEPTSTINNCWKKYLLFLSTTACKTSHPHHCVLLHCILRSLDQQTTYTVLYTGPFIHFISNPLGCQTAITALYLKCHGPPNYIFCYHCTECCKLKKNVNLRNLLFLSLKLISMRILVKKVYWKNYLHVSGKSIQ